MRRELGFSEEQMVIWFINPEWDQTEMALHQAKWYYEDVKYTQDKVSQYVRKSTLITTTRSKINIV